MCNLSKFCYACFDNKASLKSFDCLSNGCVMILNALFKSVWLSEDNMHICEVCAEIVKKTLEFLNKCITNCKLLKNNNLHELKQKDNASTSSQKLQLTTSDSRENECNKSICSTTENMLDNTEEFVSDNIDSEVCVKQESDLFCGIREYSEVYNSYMESMKGNAEESNMNAEIDVNNEESDVTRLGMDASAENLYVNFCNGTDNNFTSTQTESEFQGDDTIHSEFDIKSVLSEYDVSMDHLESDMWNESGNLTFNMDVEPSNTVEDMQNFMLNTDVAPNNAVGHVQNFMLNMDVAPNSAVGETDNFTLNTGMVPNNTVQNKKKRKSVNKLGDRSQQLDGSLMLENEKKYVHKCTVCGRMCKTTWTLRLHMQSHKEKKPYKCLRCEKDYLWMKNLQRHVKKNHP